MFFFYIPQLSDIIKKIEKKDCRFRQAKTGSQSLTDQTHEWKLLEAPVPEQDKLNYKWMNCWRLNADKCE